MDREDKTPCDECGVLEHERSMNFVGDKFVCVHCENDLESEEEYDDLKFDMIQYLKMLDLGLSIEEIIGKATTVIRDFKRRGNVQYFSRKDAEDWVGEQYE